jgi:Arc/MetJ-type ribon-helix-helix transcriptional regulator
MSVITVPVSDKQEAFIEEMVEDGTAANKAHAVRMAIDLLAREQAVARIRKGQDEVRGGKALKGDLEKLARLID